MEAGERSGVRTKDGGDAGEGGDLDVRWHSGAE